MKAQIGEIWLVTIPILGYDEENNVNIKLQKRPCLIIDDGRGLIVEDDNRIFHILNITALKTMVKKYNKLKDTTLSSVFLYQIYCFIHNKY